MALLLFNCMCFGPKLAQIEPKQAWSEVTLNWVGLGQNSSKIGQNSLKMSQSWVLMTSSEPKWLCLLFINIDPKCPQIYTKQGSDDIISPETAFLPCFYPKFSQNLTSLKFDDVISLKTTPCPSFYPNFLKNTQISVLMMSSAPTWCSSHIFTLNLPKFRF